MQTPHVHAGMLTWHVPECATTASSTPDTGSAAGGNAANGGRGWPTGSGFANVWSTGTAFAARQQSDGSLVCWGHAANGGSGCPTMSGFSTDVAAVKHAWVTNLKGGEWGKDHICAVASCPHRSVPLAHTLRCYVTQAHHGRLAARTWEPLVQRLSKHPRPLLRLPRFSSFSLFLFLSVPRLRWVGLGPISLSLFACLPQVCSPACGRHPACLGRPLQWWIWRAIGSFCGPDWHNPTRICGPPGRRIVTSMGCQKPGGGRCPGHLGMGIQLQLHPVRDATEAIDPCCRRKKSTMPGFRSYSHT